MKIIFFNKIWFYWRIMKFFLMFLENENFVKRKPFTTYNKKVFGLVNLYVHIRSWKLSLINNRTDKELKKMLNATMTFQLNIFRWLQLLMFFNDVLRSIPYNHPVTTHLRLLSLLSALHFHFFLFFREVLHIMHKIRKIWIQHMQFNKTRLPIFKDVL